MSCQYCGIQPDSVNDMSKESERLAKIDPKDLMPLPAPYDGTAAFNLTNFPVVSIFTIEKTCLYVGLIIFPVFRRLDRQRKITTTQAPAIIT